MNTPPKKIVLRRPRFGTYAPAAPARKETGFFVRLVRLVAYSITVFVVVGAALAWPSWRSAHKGTDPLEVYLTTTMQIKNVLKAPASAKFSPPTGERSGAVNTSGTTWHVWGWVDSQNSFGAMLRKEWTAEVDFLGDRVKFRGFTLDGETFVR